MDIEGYENRPFDARAATALEEMLADAEAAGNKLYLVSGYRSVARQKALFERKVASFTEEGLPREQAEKNAAQWVARLAEGALRRVWVYSSLPAGQRICNWGDV